MSCDCGDRDWSYAAVSQGMTPEANRKAWNKFFARAIKRVPCPHFDFGFLSSRTMKQYISVLNISILWYSVMAAPGNQ